MAEIDVYKEWLGIPEEQRPPNHYQLLRVVEFEDDMERIQGFYKKLNAHVRKYATGQYSLESQELLNELAKAMLCLTDPVRKREYDESLGREFEEDPYATKTVSQLLVENGTLTRDQSKEVDEFAERRGLSFRDAVVQMKLANAETAARALAQELSRSYVDLTDLYPDDSVLDQIPRNLVKKHAVLPLFIDDDVLLIACSDEPDHDLEDELRLRLGIPMRGVIATPLAINHAIAKYYAPGARDESAVATASKQKAKSKSKSKDKKSKDKGEKKSILDKGEDARENKMIGIIILCWCVAGGYALDNFVLLPLFNRLGILSNWATLIFLMVLAPLLAAYPVYDKYFKK